MLLTIFAQLQGLLQSINLNLLTGVIAPQMGPIGSSRKKRSCFFWVKSRAANNHKQKLGIRKV